MALIECPECNKSISDLAKSCPSCGYLLRGQATAKGGTQKIILVLAIFFGVFGAVVGLTVGNPIFGAIGVFSVIICLIKLVLG